MSDNDKAPFQETKDIDMKKTSNPQSFLQTALEISPKSRAYFEELGKTEPLVAMDENNRICKYYPDGHIEVLKDLANA